MGGCTGKVGGRVCPVILSLNLGGFVICLSTKDGPCETVGYDTALLCYGHMFNPYLVPISSSPSNSFGICNIHS